MHVVGHQDIAVNGAAIISRRLAKPIAIARIVFIGKEGRRAIVAALDQVQRLIRQEVTAKPRHRSTREHHALRSVPVLAEKINSDPNSQTHEPRRIAPYFHAAPAWINLRMLSSIV